MSVDDINETLSFYHFFRAEFSGKHKIYLAESAIAKIQNYQEIRDVLIHETGALPRMRFPFHLLWRPVNNALIICHKSIFSPFEVMNGIYRKA